MKRTSLRLASSVVVTAALAMSALYATGAAAAQLKIETYAGPKHAMNTTAWPEWMKRIGEASNGAVETRLTYPPIDPRDLYDRVREGITDISFITHGYTTGRFLLTNMIELPGMGGNAEQMSVAFWRVYTKHFMQHNEHKGVVLLSLFTHGPGVINTRKEIKSVDDLRGLKIRTGGDTQGAVAKRLGIVTVSAPATQAQELIARGVVDGIFFSIESITALQLGDVLSHHYALPGGLYTAGFAVVMNQRSFDALSADERKALQSVTGEPMARWMGSVWDGSDKYSIGELTKKGNTVTQFDAQATAAINAKLADLDDAWIDAAKKEGVADPAAILKELRDEVRKVTSQ